MIPLVTGDGFRQALFRFCRQSVRAIQEAPPVGVVTTLETFNADFSTTALVVFSGQVGFQCLNATCTTRQDLGIGRIGSSPFHVLLEWNT